MPEGGPDKGEAVADQLRQARTAISDAEGARDANLSDEVVVNRCYYACFHAAQAVLLNGAFPQTLTVGYSHCLVLRWSSRGMPLAPGVDF